LGLFHPKHIRGNRIVLVREGIMDPESPVVHMVKRLRFLPRKLPGTSTTGLSVAYQAFCVASQEYHDFFIRKGARPEKIVVTGIQPPLLTPRPSDLLETATRSRAMPVD
jgi:hypothetical protein